jgi:hypothetical protein
MIVNIGGDHNMSRQTWAEALVVYFLVRYHEESGSGDNVARIISSVCYAIVTALDAFSSLFMILLTSTQCVPTPLSDDLPQIPKSALD